MLFTNIMLGLIKEHNLDIDISNKDSFSVFDECVEAGIGQGEIIKKFETSLNMPFIDVMKKDPDYAFLKKYSLSKIQIMCVYPFVKDGVLNIAMPDNSKIDLVDSLVGNDEYVPVFSFDFLIEQKLSEIEDSLEEVVSIETSREVVEINENRKSIILATGQDTIDVLIEESPLFRNSLYVLDKIHRRELICEKCEELMPDILLVGDNIGGKSPLIKYILQAHALCPSMRIIFLTGAINPGDEIMLGNIGLLASVGIYDIITDSEIAITKLNYVIEHPQTENDVKFFIEKVKDSSGKRANKEIIITVAEEQETEDTVRVYENLYAIVSPYGAVGKSTIVQNIAIALNNHAMPNVAGRKPRIAIIDLDFQGFSTSRFFDTLNKENHIFSAIEAAHGAIDDLGEMRDTLSKVQEVEINEKIHKAFVQTKKYKNVYVMGGDDKVYRRGDMLKLNSYYLTFIIESVINDFDIILIDANTSIECSVIYPLYHMSYKIFNVLDVSTQCFNLNKRFITYLEDVSIYQPFNNSFILNKAFDLTDAYLTINDIQKALGINFDYVLPKIPDSIAFNMECKNENIIETSEDVNAIKCEIITMANDITPLKDFEEIIEKLNIPASQRFKKKEKPVVIEETQSKDKKEGFLSKIFKKKGSIEIKEESVDED